MKLITTHRTDDGQRLQVYDAGTDPATVVIRADAPGERAVSAPIPLEQLTTALREHYGVA